MFGKEIWEAMFAHAKEEDPAECCGIVTEDQSGTQVVHLCENIQAKFHEAAPETLSRIQHFHCRPTTLLRTRGVPEH